MTSLMNHITYMHVLAGTRAEPLLIPAFKVGIHVYQT